MNGNDKIQKRNSHIRQEYTIVMEPLFFLGVVRAWGKFDVLIREL